MGQFHISPIQVILIAAIVILNVIFIITYSYVNKYKKKAALLFADSIENEVTLVINPVITKKEAKKNKLITFKLLQSAKKRNDYSIYVNAVLNANDKSNKPFITLYTYKDNDLIYVEHIDDFDCHLVVKYFVLSYLE